MMERLNFQQPGSHSNTILNAPLVPCVWVRVRCAGCSMQYDVAAPDMATALRKTSKCLLCQSKQTEVLPTQTGKGSTSKPLLTPTVPVEYQHPGKSKRQAYFARMDNVMTDDSQGKHSSRHHDTRKRRKTNRHYAMSKRG